MENLESNRKRGRVAYEADDVDRMYGATWLLDRVAAVNKLIADKKPVANQDDARKHFNILKLTFNDDNTIASFEENAEKKASM
ncbi:MAG: hypothetical protein Q4E55_07540, partial [Bacteroidales bacterium]|nr:hypothetical protein [Bacteroidales bacterium]